MNPFEHVAISIGTLRKQLEKSGLSLPDRATEKLWQYHTMLREANPLLNLTRIHNFESIVRKHYVDSIYPVSLLEQAGVHWPGLSLDLGSGAGFPGIPLAIVLPERKFILTEGRKKRTDFLRSVVAELELSNVEVLEKKLHAGIQSPRVDAILARAVASLSRLIQAGSGVLRPSGLFIFWKGPSAGAEEAPVRNLPVELILRQAYRLPHSRDERLIYVYRYLGQKQVAIESERNARYRLLEDIQHSKGIRKHGRCLLAGRRFIEEHSALNRPIEALITTRELQWEGPAGAERWIVPADLFQRLDSSRSHFPLALLAAPPIPEWDGRLSGLTVLLSAGEPENLGAALRTAHAFGVRQIVLLEEAAHPYLPRALRAAAGATFDLDLYRGPTLDRAARLSGVYTLDRRGPDLEHSELETPLGLLVGPEGGLPAAPANPLSIAQEAGESLNLAVALGIALYTLRKKL
ncbi:MAG: 16S rRNA (guanine(527)-N(7))-methyltransferase RsmG [Spirochaetales bacterium]|nr:16S rRNA (guanine(527)-N(7))-methyltransferase RsmG [Spirochaetales bacterium]